MAADGGAGAGAIPGWLPGATLALAATGTAAAGYLTVEHFTAATTLACPETGTINCAKVTTSSYSSLLGVPVAVLGLLYFLAMAALCLPAAWRSQRGLVRSARLAGAFGGAVFVLYLLWAELFRINAICLWCTGVHAVALGLFALVVLGHALDTARPPQLSRPPRRAPSDETD